MMIYGSAYHTRSGIGLGIGLMRHGKLGRPPQLRPRITPISESGSTHNIHMASIDIIEPKGIARVEFLAIAIKFTPSTTIESNDGKRPDITKIRRTQFFPILLILRQIKGA
jgi:hypothetical protein